MSPERAAYFMRRFKSEEKLLGPNEQAAVDYVLSLLAQHDCIVGALRAENAKLSEALDECDGDRWKLRSERDAALARVAELEMLLRKLSTNGLMQFSTVDEEMAVQAVLGGAPVAQAQHSVPDGWRIERSAERIVVMNLNNGAGYAAARDGESGIAESVLYLLAADLLAAAPGKEGV